MTTTPPDLLSRALDAPGEPPLRLLPAVVAELLRCLGAPPRLAAHLRAVHDVAVELADWVRERYPDLAVDRDAVLSGAATHDVGKILYPEELAGPGSAHEEAGRGLLVDHGFTPSLARFAATHARWDGPAATMEDLLVRRAREPAPARTSARSSQRSTSGIEEGPPVADAGEGLHAGPPCS